MAIAKTFLGEGTIYDWHSHKETEVLVVYEGEMRVYREGGEHEVFLPGEAAHISPGENHRVETPVDTWVVAITVPAAKEFPR